jgi:hypothetical protein
MARRLTKIQKAKQYRLKRKLTNLNQKIGDWKLMIASQRRFLNKMQQMLRRDTMNRVEVKRKLREIVK